AGLGASNSGFCGSAACGTASNGLVRCGAAGGGLCGGGVCVCLAFGGGVCDHATKVEVLQRQTKTLVRLNGLKKFIKPNSFPLGAPTETSACYTAFHTARVSAGVESFILAEHTGNNNVPHPAQVGVARYINF